MRRPIPALALATFLLAAAVAASGSTSPFPPASTVNSGGALFDHASDEVSSLSAPLRLPRADLAATSNRTTAAATSARSTTLATSNTPVTEKVWVSVVSATTRTSDDVNGGMSKAAIAKLIGYVNGYWAGQSMGAVSFVFGGYETRSLGTSTCNAGAVLTSEASKAFGGRFADGSWAGTNDHLLVLTRESCGGQSFATVSTHGGEIFSGNGIGEAMGRPYLLHEFGHNLGFAHADGTICASTSSFDASIAEYGFSSTRCPTTEYDDYLDIMGFTVRGATPNLSSVQRILSGWMTNYVTVDGGAATRTITLMPLGTSGGVQSVVIVDPASGEKYYVEYRAPVGLDKTSAEFAYRLRCRPARQGYSLCDLGGNPRTGMVRVLRALPVGGAVGTTAVAVTKVSGSSLRRTTNLSSGQGFWNFDGGFSVRINSLSITRGASITISLAK